MNKRILLMALVSSTGLACSCSGGYVKVASALFEINGSPTTITSSTAKTIYVIGAYRFESSQYKDLIKDFDETWYFSLTYSIDLINNKVISENVPKLQNIINVSLMDTDLTINKATLKLESDCGEYESYNEAFINPTDFNGKVVSHTFIKRGNTGPTPFPKSLIYQGYSSSYVDTGILFFKNNKNSMYTIQNIDSNYPKYFIQGDNISYIDVSDNTKNVSVTYTVWPY